MKKLFTRSVLFALVMFPIMAMGQEVQKPLELATEKAFTQTSQDELKCIGAAFSGNLTELKKCLANGFDVNTKFQGVPISFSALAHLPVLSYLIQDTRFDVNATDEDGRTLLMHAMMEGKLELATQLISWCKADITLKDSFGYTANTYERIHHKDATELLNQGLAPMDKGGAVRMAFFLTNLTITNAEGIARNFSVDKPISPERRKALLQDAQDNR